MYHDDRELKRNIEKLVANLKAQKRTVGSNPTSHTSEMLGTVAQR